MRVARFPPRAPGAVMHGALSINSFRRSRPQQQIMRPVPALPDPAQLAAAATEEPPPEPRAALQLESAPPPPDPLRRRPDYRLSPDYGSIPILTHLALPPRFSAQEATSSSRRCVPQAAGGSAAGKPTRQSNRAQHDYTSRVTPATAAVLLGLALPDPAQLACYATEEPPPSPCRSRGPSHGRRCRWSRRRSRRIRCGAVLTMVFLRTMVPF